MPEYIIPKSSGHPSNGRHSDREADRPVLLRLYRSPARFKLVYRFIVYWSTRQWNLRLLDPIHHQGLRIARGAFRTSPAKSLYVEAHEPSLSFRRLKRSLNEVTKLKSRPDNPAYSCFPPIKCSPRRGISYKNPTSRSLNFTTLGEIRNKPWSDR